MMKKRMLGVIAVLLVCIFALSACKKEAGKPVDNAVSENTTDDSEDTDQTENESGGSMEEDKEDTEEKDASSEETLDTEENSDTEESL